MERVFLDANVLFSAAYRPNAGIAGLWKLARVELVTSRYALVEARSALDTPEQFQRLERFSHRMTIVHEAPERPLPPGLSLPEKDHPILKAALFAMSTCLLTGDVRHFGPCLGRSVEGMKILLPADFLSRHSGRRRRS